MLLREIIAVVALSVLIVVFLAIAEQDAHPRAKTTLKGLVRRMVGYHE